jgi:hypothetical protein
MILLALPRLLHQEIRQADRRGLPAVTQDLDSLFETKANLGNDSTREELEAVAAGNKALSFIQFPSLSLGTHPFYPELRQIAFELDLYIVTKSANETEPDPRLRVANVFLTRPMELWRIPAFSSFKKVFEEYDWNDAAEHFESVLLGYSEEDISKWLETRARSQISWRGRTFYLLLSSTDADGVRALAKRCLDPRLITQPILAFFNRQQNPMRTDADGLVSSGCVLARVSVRQSFFRDLFGRPTAQSDSDVSTALLTPETAAKMNSALESNFQFLEAGTWR